MYLHLYVKNLKYFTYFLLFQREDSGISGISTSATATTIDGSYGNDSVRSEVCSKYFLIEYNF